MDGCTVFGGLLMVVGVALCWIGIGGYVFMCRKQRDIEATAKAALEGQEAFWADFNARLAKISPPATRAPQIGEEGR